MATLSSIFAWRIPWTEGSLVGYSPWGSKESETTEQLRFYKVVELVVGECDGTPLQYSCLEKSHGWRRLVGCSSWGREE